MSGLRAKIGKVETRELKERMGEFGIGGQEMKTSWKDEEGTRQKRNMGVVVCREKEVKKGPK